LTEALNPNSTTARVIGLTSGTTYQFRLVVKSTSVSDVIETTTTHSKVYNLELGRWGIYNDGTHPVETTKGFNDALKWAHDNGKTTFKVPAGRYLIKKGEPYDPDSRINMVSDMTFEMDDNAVLQKETNGKERYELFYIGPGVKNVILKGGAYLGDRGTHNFSQKDSPYTSGTHESGYGILAEGAVNLIIDGVKSKNFTGDGLAAGAKAELIRALSDTDFESGAIDSNGNIKSDSTKIRTKNRVNLDNPIFQIEPSFVFDRPENISSDVSFDVYFYKANGTLISTVTNQKIAQSFVPIPAEASYFFAVFDTPSAAGIKLQLWSKVLSKNVTVKNSEFAFNRRQGITVGGVDNILIANNVLHDMGGTAPESGIDVEGGFFPNNNVKIKNNHFYNNKRYDLILYDGSNAVVDGNVMESRTIGLAVSKPFSNAIVTNNTFKDGDILIEGKNVEIQNNSVSNARINLAGTGISLDNATLTDVSLRFNSSAPFGVTASNLTIINNGLPNTEMYVGNQPVHLKDITIKGKTGLRNITGNGSDKSIYDNIKVEGYNVYYGMALPAGTYNNCLFESNESESNALQINRVGKYVFNQCTFKNYNRTMVIDNLFGAPDVTITHSTFHLSQSAKNAVIYATGANNLNLLNNVFNAKQLTSTSVPIIKIGSSKDKPAQVLGAAIKGNVIYTNLATAGIDTFDGGTGAPPYDIENNNLYNAKLRLTPKDINTNNQELTQ
jgi:hypothetical protein